MVDLGDEGGSGNSGFKPNPPLTHIPETGNTGQEEGITEPLGSPFQVAVFVDLGDPGEAEDIVSPAL